MNDGLDPRLITVGIEVNGATKTYNQELAITAVGFKSGNAIQNNAQVIIANVDRATQDYILSETSPYNLNRSPKIITVDAGRVSYGVSRVFYGNIIRSKPTQPPDIGLVMDCLTNAYEGGSIISRSQPANSSFSQICAQAAQDLNVNLNFQATDKTIGNYAYSGSAKDQIESLNQQGLYNVYVDDQELVVKDANKPLRGKVRVISKSTGMIGIPEITERGVNVKFLYDNQTKLGNAITIKSEMYKAANGTYNIFRLGFQLTSRDIPFYYIAEASRPR